ncbi:hypothetical protein CBC_0390 [Clostridium botulinum C str. Eklund]|nr:hypothetical protein CBC_0390 [Clostridium botulinum C str. Eklund]
MSAPSPFSALPPLLNYPTLALKLFRGEPAISEFDWNFSAIHSSSHGFQRQRGSDLHGIYFRFILAMDRSLGFGSTICN